MQTLIRILISWLLCYSLTYAQIVTIPIPGSPLSLNVMANPQPLQNIYANPSATAYQLWDDSWANVPLGFDFPFFNRTFNNSTMYSNGAVQFGPPLTGFPAGNNTFCCSGITVDRTTPSAYNYSILMLQTDLYGASGRNHYSLGTANSMTYGWYDVERLGDPVNKSSFELKIDSRGGIDMRWTGTIITMNTPAIGIIGNAAQGEFAVIQQGSIPGTFTLPGLTQWTTGQTPDVVALDPCISNPLASQTCSGYQAAYLIQQCSQNALYSTSCSGYQSAYTLQQCSINSLYDSSCPGYQNAYYEQQCLLNPLYDLNCPGYARAYLDQQCSLNPLYSTTCSGYAVAYKTQQCTANALYATDCPGYETAYLNSKCIIDSLYSNKCEGYATAYAIKYLVVNINSATINSSLSATAAVKANDPTSTVVATNTASTTIASDGSVSTGVSATGDTNVDKLIAPKPAATSAHAAVPLVTTPPATPPESKQEAKAGTGSQSTQASEPSAPKAAPTARQEMQAKREAAAKAKAVEQGKSLAADIGKANDMEQQKQVQNIVIQAMGYTPGFDAYSQATIQDTVSYKPFTVYGNQKTVDNRNTSRMFTGTDKLHSELVDSQYKGK